MALSAKMAGMQSLVFLGESNAGIKQRGAGRKATGLMDLGYLSEWVGTSAKGPASAPHHSDWRNQGSVVGQAGV